MTIPTYPSTPQNLPPMASWPATPHKFEPDDILALQAAEATGRPLLIRGEAGTGKSQLAHAAAAATGRAFLPVVVAAATEAADLHWRFDAIARLADAQSRDTKAGDIGVTQYLYPGQLWWATNWETAQAQQFGCRHANIYQPDTPKGWTPDKGVVLLIDEIDKAEPDMPNGLLEALANGAFDVPMLGRTVRHDPAKSPRPLIIVTTNDERELPAAFLRRCLVLTLALPKDDGPLREYLVARGRLHFAGLKQDVLEDAAQLLVQDRSAAKAQRVYAPGLAEYLDLLRAVHTLGPQQAAAGLKKLKQFFFLKQPAGDSAA